MDNSIKTVDDIAYLTNKGYDFLINQQHERLQRDLINLFDQLPQDVIDQPTPTRAMIADTFGAFEAQIATRLGQPAVAPTANPYEDITSGFDAIISEHRRSPMVVSPMTLGNNSGSFRQGCAEIYKKLEVFELNSNLSGRIVSDIFYTQTSREFSETVVRRARLSSSISNQSDDLQNLDQLPTAVYIPNVGCVVNGARIGNGFSEDSAWDNDALRSGIIKAIAENQLGRGFVLEHTNLGRMMQDNGLWNAQLVNQLGEKHEQRQVNTPNAVACLREIQYASVFARSGWRSFITERVHYRLGQNLKIKLPYSGIQELFDVINECIPELKNSILAAAKAFYLLKDITDFAARYITIEICSKTLVFILKIILRGMRDNITADRLNWAIQMLHILNRLLKPAMQTRNYEDMGAWVGRLMLHRIENLTQSTFNVPYAVALALNNTHHLVKLSPERLQTTLAGQALANPDTRLAMLCLLKDQGVGSPNDLRRVAKDQWGLI